MSDERRREDRVPAIIDVIWENDFARYHARTSDLTVSGCFIDTVGQATLGEKIKAKLRLPTAEWIEIEGEVAYASPPSGLGVRFTSMSDADRKKLEWLVKAEDYKTKKENKPR